MLLLSRFGVANVATGARFVAQGQEGSGDDGVVVEGRKRRASAQSREKDCSGTVLTTPNTR